MKRYTGLAVMLLLCMGVYVTCYVCLIDRMEYTPFSVGSGRTLIVPAYRVEHWLVLQIFRPLEWLDVKVIRPSYWMSEDDMEMSSQLRAR